MFIKNCIYMITRVTLVTILVTGMFNVQPAKAGSVEFGWAQSLGGTGFNYGTAIALDDSGNVYIAGFESNSQSNIPLSKLDNNGNFIWTKFIACPSGCRANTITTDNDGNVYIAGQFWATVDFDPGEGATNLTSTGSADIFVGKFDSNGNFLWAKSIGGMSDDAGNGVAVDKSGNVYLTGNYSDTVDFDPGEGISSLTSPGLYYDVFISKFDGYGSFIWAKGMGGMSDDEGFDIAVDGTGAILVTGMFSLTADFDPGAGISTLTSPGGYDLFVSKLDSNGNFIWANSGGEATLGAGIEIALDRSENIYIAGYHSTSLPDYFDVAISKWDRDGNYLWMKIMGGTSPDAAYGIAVDTNGSVYVTGEFGGTVDFDPGVGTSNLTSAGGNDIFINKLDTNGNFLWAKSLGGTSSDLGDGIAVDRNGNLYVTGFYSDTVDFDPGMGVNNLTSMAGSRDIFIAKLAFTPQTYYVKWDASGANNGTSWANAFMDLQSALTAASAGDEIWVAAGTYKPTNTTDRAISFTLKNGVAIYGGFAGTEAVLSERNLAANLTILSGDISAVGNANDNSYHVVTASDTDNTAILDGFTITAGNANGTDIAAMGGGMYNYLSHPSVTNIIFRENYAIFGGGMNNDGVSAVPPTPAGEGSNPSLINVSFINNSAIEGGGLRNEDNSSPTLTNVVFDGNRAQRSGGGMENYAYNNTVLTNVTFKNNIVSNEINDGGGGGMINFFSVPVLTNVTFDNNSAPWGGGVFNVGSNSILTNVTFINNISTKSGGGIGNYQSSPILTNVTFSGNSALTSGGGIYNESNSSLTVRNTILWDNTALTGAQIYNDNASASLVSASIIQGGYPGTGNLDADPLLNTLQDNGGLTKTMALLPGSPAINAGSDSNCPETDQRGVTRPQGSHCDMGAYEAEGIKVKIGGLEMNSYFLAPSESKRESYPGINNGPLSVANMDNGPILGAERVIYKVNGVNTSFTEMMGLPNSQLHNTYWLPWYNNADLDTQLRIGNVSENPATVHIFIGGTEVTPPAGLNLESGASTRLHYPGVNNGPVKIQSDHGVPIVAAERLIYKVSGTPTSFAEMMGLPDSQLDTTYWLPWYNNLDLDSQLRIGNVSGNPATIHIFIGGTEVTPAAGINLASGASARLSYPSVNNGPVKIQSNQNIIAAERVIYKVNGLNTSFTEMMALPNSQLNTTYWLPWYNNMDLDTQLRIGNVSGNSATIHIFIGGTEVTPVSGLSLANGASTRLSYPGVNNGPVKIQSNQNIVAAERVIYKVNNIPTGFSEIMSLPNSQLDTTYWLPWYNNVDLDTQLRFGMP